MKLASFLLLALPISACSSADFAVSEIDAGSGSDAPIDETGGTTDAATDTFVDPCAPQEGVAKFCVDVKLDTAAHPGYDAASGASSLGIDGKGIVYVSLYDKDPAGAAEGAAAPTPKAVLQYPTVDHIDEEANIDSDLPVTLAGRASPGTYWVITQFADNKAKRGTGENSVLPGDFVIVPGVDPDARTAIYPKVTLKNGETGRVDQKLRPYRRVDIDVGITAEIATQAKMNPTIHGNGPVLFGVYDGNIEAKTSSFLSVSFHPCVDLKPAVLPPTRPRVWFGTTVDGAHNLLTVLFDYKTDLSAGGNFFSATSEGTINPIPKVNISATSWTSTASADFSAVYFPYSPASTIEDKLTCE